MTSILDNTSAMNHNDHADCGGTILSGPDHVYCDECGATAYYGEDMDAETWEDAMTEIQGLGAGDDNL